MQTNPYGELLNYLKTEDIVVVEIEVPAINTIYTKALPTGYTATNSVILGSSYYNSGNGNWYSNSLDTVAAWIQSPNVNVVSATSYVTKVKVILLKVS